MISGQSCIFTWMPNLKFIFQTDFNVGIDHCFPSPPISSPDSIKWLKLWNFWSKIFIYDTIPSAVSWVFCIYIFSSKMQWSFILSFQTNWVEHFWGIWVIFGWTISFWYQIPKIYLRLWFQFGQQRIWDLAIVCP